MSFERSIDIFIFSTTEKEGLGNAVLEAISVGVPVLVSDLPMMREILPKSYPYFFKAGNHEILTEKVVSFNGVKKKSVLSIEVRKHCLKNFEHLQYQNNLLSHFEH